jgi:hypothetical protein
MEHGGAHIVERGAKQLKKVAESQRVHEWNEARVCGARGSRSAQPAKSGTKAKKLRNIRQFPVACGACM